MSAPLEHRISNNFTEDLNDNERSVINVSLRINGDEFTYAKEMYKTHRDYIVHEDGLVNQRTTWAITIESFTIAVFGLTYSERMKGLLAFHSLDEVKKTTNSAIKTNQIIELFDLLLVMIAGFGLVVALISGMAVYAAQHAIDGVCRRWKDECGRNQICEVFPQLVGGGNNLATTLGHALPLALPGFFILFWLFAIFYVTILQRVLMLNDILPDVL